MNCQIDVLYEDNHLLIVNKPALVATMGARAGEQTLVDRARTYLVQKYRKPGNAFVGVVSRLDAHVTGICVLTRTSKAASRMTRQFQQHRVTKVYRGLVGGSVEPDHGRYVDWLIKDEVHHRMRVGDAGQTGAREARMQYRLIQCLTVGSLLELDLETGRKHQIRVQLAHRGHPIVGDRKYGSRQRFVPGIALHAYRLEFEHPVRHDWVRLVCPLPSYWAQMGLRVD